MSRVLIAHPYPAMCAGLEGGLARAQGIEVVGAVSRGEEALRLILQLEPDVALVACSLAGALDGVAITQRARVDSRVVRVLALSAPGDDGPVYRMWRAGAIGCISERAELRSIVGAVRAAACGRSLWTSEHMVQLEHWWDEVGSRLEALTARERQVLLLVADGLSNCEIALRLVFSENTIDPHIRNVFSKLHVNRRVEAAMFVAREPNVCQPKPKITDSSDDRAEQGMIS